MIRAITQYSDGTVCHHCSADVQEDEKGQFYIHPMTGLRVDKPADGWPKDHRVEFITKIILAEVHKTQLRNRDGEILLGKDSAGTCYLIAEANSWGDKQEFVGINEKTEHIKITLEAYNALVASLEIMPPDAE